MKKSRWRLKKLNIENDINFVHFDLLDESKINKEIRLGKYNEIYNLAAQSYVDKSFKNPIYTSDINALGVTRILEAIRHFSNYSNFIRLPLPKCLEILNLKAEMKKQISSQSVLMQLQNYMHIQW